MHATMNSTDGDVPSLPIVAALVDHEGRSLKFHFRGKLEGNAAFADVPVVLRWIERELHKVFVLQKTDAGNTPQNYSL